MPKNLKGGNKAKKGKNTTALKAELHDIGEDQMIGKVIRMLGDRRALVYCNDNVERVCKIRGKLRKKVWIATSDIVLVGLRVFSNLQSDDESDEDIAAAIGPKVNTSSGDILAKYDAEVYSKLKKVAGVNKRLFGSVDAVDKKSGGGVFKEEDEAEDDLFDDGRGDVDDDDDSEEEASTKGKKIAWKRAANATAAAVAVAASDDVDIDAI